MNLYAIYILCHFIAHCHFILGPRWFLHFFFYINFVRYYILVLLCLVVLIIVPDSFNRRDWKNCNHRNLLILLQLVSCVIFFFFLCTFVSNLLMSQYHYFWGMSIALVHFQYLDRMKFLSTICIGTICVDSDNILFLSSYYISDSLHCLVPTQWNLYFAISL